MCFQESYASRTKREIGEIKIGGKKSSLSAKKNVLVSFGLDVFMFYSGID